MGGRCCRRMWALLQLHAKQCTVADCPVLRCRELRQMRRLQMARQEEKRRVAYKNMLRNQVCHAASPLVSTGLHAGSLVAYTT
jgi:E1A/CREB-binding protein